MRAVIGSRTDPFRPQVAREPADFLLVRLLPLPRPDRVLVLMWLVDLNVAKRGLGRRTGAQADTWLVRHATDRRRVEVTWNDGALERALERLWDSNADRFRSRGDWWPNGKIEVRTNWMPPFQVGVDDRRVRTATAATTVVGPVATGAHRITVESGTTRVQRTVSVDMGSQVILHLEDEARLDMGFDERPLLLWTGVGLAAVGLVVTVAGLAAPVQTEVLQVCTASTSCSDSSEFARVSDYFSSRESPGDGSGPLVVPLGYSLALTGGAWALTSLLSDDPNVPWWAVVLGVAAGGAAYGLSEALQ